MFRIRRLTNSYYPTNKKTIEHIQKIVKDQFPDERKEFIDNIPTQMDDPFSYGFQTIIFVADDYKNNVKGFAILYHFIDLNFCFLDYIAAAFNITGRGIGGALYERIREEVIDLKSNGLFFECLPDDPNLSHNPTILKQNIKRLKFYENYGAVPVINTGYETPIKAGEDNPPYLVFDKCGKDITLEMTYLKKIVKAILERKYADICDQQYNDLVINSIKDDPVKLRPLKYIRKEVNNSSKTKKTELEDKVILIVSEKHKLHHVKERGYVESPTRIQSILDEINKTDMFLKIKSNHYEEKHIKAVHNKDFVDYLNIICKKMEMNKSVYPYVFPIRNQSKKPKDMAIRAGYYCIDTFTPLNKNAYIAAKNAVDCALSGADKILEGHKLVYALVRPPGHHAESKAFGGFCYFNSSAIAANYLTRFGKAAMLDLDFHHGNGQQEIFYSRNDVLTISIHGNPYTEYPYFTGFSNEKGDGDGFGYNINYPLNENITGDQYRLVLKKALNKTKKFNPDFIVIPFGLDTSKGDPTGNWLLNKLDFEINGEMIGELKKPILVIQEGGYNTKVLGKNTAGFFKGLQCSMLKN